MSRRIPDLWTQQEDAMRLYSLYLCRLQKHRLYESVISACRQIRRIASQNGDPKSGLVTTDFEIDAHCALKQYKAAWRQVRLREKILSGKQLDLANHAWTFDDAWLLEFCYAPILYFLGRYTQGRRLCEIALSFWFELPELQCFNILSRVCNEDAEPTCRQRVTLHHFYKRIGKKLSEWEHWQTFVNGFHPRLFRLAGVGRDELLSDSRKLATFSKKLMRILRERTPHGFNSGQKDLIQSASIVAKRQKKIQERTLRADIERVSRNIITDAKLVKLFPELRGLKR